MRLQQFVMILLVLAGGTLGSMASTGGKKILMVVTGADTMTNGKPTGLWLEEFAVPYLLFKAEGYFVTVASPQGGKAPVDERSLEDAQRVLKWSEAVEALNDTQPLAALKASDYDAIFIPGGHGTMFDFPKNQALKNLLRDFDAENKVIASVCHGPAAFVGVFSADGVPLVKNKTVTSFTDEEEKAVQLDKAVPFLLESQLRKDGAKFVAGEMWKPNVQVDGQLVTGQNPASSQGAAEAVIRLLKQGK